jgi:hypothetical protein
MSTAGPYDHSPISLSRGRRLKADPALRTFTFYIEDDRYSVPTLHIAAMEDEALAREWAETAMRRNPHYLGVEVCEDGERLFGLGVLAERPR